MINSINPILSGAYNPNYKLKDPKCKESKARDFSKRRLSEITSR